MLIIVAMRGTLCRSVTKHGACYDNSGFIYKFNISKNIRNSKDYSFNKVTVHHNRLSENVLRKLTPN